MGTSGARGGGGLEQQAGGIFSASDGGRGEATGGGTGIGSGVIGAKETVLRERTSILGVWNSGEYSGEAGTLGKSGEPTAEIGGLRRSAQWHKRFACREDKSSMQRFQPPTPDICQADVTFYLLDT